MKKVPSVHAGHRSRMRARFFQGGLDGFAAHEVIELILYFAIPLRDVNELAHALIDRFGSVEGVLKASDEELTKVPGVGPHTSKVIRTIERLREYYDKRRRDRTPKVIDIRDVMRREGEAIRDMKQVRLSVVYVSVNGDIVMRRDFGWTLRHAACVREVITGALECNAQYVALLLRRENEAEEIPEAEREEILRLLNALIATGVRPLDCVIVTKEWIYSMFQDGSLQIEDTGVRGRRKGDSAWLEPLRKLRSENGWYRLSDVCDSEWLRLEQEEKAGHIPEE